MDSNPPPARLPLNTVLLGDCVELLNSLPEKSVDLVFADPPYRLQLQQELWRPNQTRVDAVDEAWDQFEDSRAYEAFSRAWLQACRRVLKDDATIWVIGTYHNIYRLGALLQDLGYWILNDVVWIKVNPMPNFRGVRFTNAQETLIWAQKVRGERYTFNYHAMKALNGDSQMRSDWLIPLCTGKERLKANGSKAHPTQKPEALLYRVILASSDPGDVVLDPFFGTGTTGAVAKKLHRHWIGIEREAAYAEMARQRIEAVEAGAFQETVYRFERPRDKARLPFGVLLEQGLLQPGQLLYLDASPDRAATVLANGHLQWAGGSLAADQALSPLTGSIHQLARAVLGGPCNGWERWWAAHPERGELVVLDQLRQTARQNLKKNSG